LVRLLQSLAFALLAQSVALGAATAPEADSAWQVILEQASGPGTRFHDRAEAVAAARSHLEKQEAALRDFLRRFPSDPRRYSAQIRLAGVLAARSKALGKPALHDEASKLLATLESDPASPPNVQADAAFARVSQEMEDLPLDPAPLARDALLRDVRAFDTAHPGDRRFAGLLTEVATLYDGDPSEKEALLADADARADDAALRSRIADDRRRISLLGRPLDLRLPPSQTGPASELAEHRGHVVVLIFWASWSLPALQELAAVMQAAPDFSGKPVEFLTVSLDEDRAALASTIHVANLKWPVYCDGKGWEGEMVRSLGLNTLPTVWILDRAGRMTTLNARGHEPDLIRAALASP
jgi:hypothetical protein